MGKLWMCPVVFPLVTARSPWGGPIPATATQRMRLPDRASNFCWPAVFGRHLLF